MKLSPHEVAWIALRAGFTTGPAKGSGVWVASEVEAFVAVCCAESGLDTEVMARSNPNPATANTGNRDHGVVQASGKWQWDKIIAAGSAWRDPVVNIGIGYQIFVAAGRQLTDWSVFNSGAWLVYLPDAKIAVAHPFPYVDPLQSLIAERDKARADLAGFQKQAADAVSELNAANARIAVLTSANQDLATRLNVANAKVTRALSDLA